MQLRKAFFGFALIAAMLVIAQPAHAVVFNLTFEGLQDQEQILDFYNGGTGGDGSGPGTNYGVSFGSGALSLIDADAGGTGNFANEPSGDTVAFWLSGGLVMNVAAGFDTGFSFYYTSSTAATITIYDGVDKTGNVIGTIDLSANYNLNCTGDPSGSFCHWDPVGVAFAGVAKSVDFGGTANQTGFDNITFGADTPQPTPEPTSLLLLGAGIIGLAIARRRS
jgi:hypothetical protein